MEIHYEKSLLVFLCNTSIYIRIEWTKFYGRKQCRLFKRAYVTAFWIQSNHSMCEYEK